MWKYLGSPTLKNRISAGVEVLIRKLLFLTLTHINEITSRLNLKEENKVIIRTNAWHLMKHIIQRNIVILKDRNVNCLIICSLYAIAKLSKIELTFEQLLNAFSQVYPANTQRVKYKLSMQQEGVISDATKPRGNIIDFYNAIFVVTNNDYLIEIRNSLDNKDPSLTPSLTEKRPLSLQESIIEEAKQTLSSMRDGIDTSRVTPMPEVVSPKSVTPNSTIILDDPKSLQNTEEQVKDVLAKLATMSPSRNPPPVTGKMSRPMPSFSPATSPVMSPPTSRPSSNIVLDYQYGHVLTEPKKKGDHGMRTSFLQVQENGKPMTEKQLQENGIPIREGVTQENNTPKPEDTTSLEGNKPIEKNTRQELQSVEQESMSDPDSKRVKENTM